MSEKKARRPVGIFGTKSQIERDVERTLVDLTLGKEEGEPLRIRKKIIKTPDSMTTITYELVVNNRTGQQEVIEHIDSNKRQCGICGTYVDRVYTCSLCGNEVCGRHYASVDILEGWKNVTYDDWNDKDFLGGPRRHSRRDPIYESVNACSNCCLARTGKRLDQST